MNHFNILTPSEEQLMRIIWQKKECFAREILDAYPEPKPHQNTISTFLKNLVEKNYLKTEKHGRVFLYKPAVALEEYREQKISGLIEDFFGGNFADFYGHISGYGTFKDYEKTNSDIKKFVKEITSQKPKGKKKKPKKKKDNG